MQLIREGSLGCCYYWLVSHIENNGDDEDDDHGWWWSFWSDDPFLVCKKIALIIMSGNGPVSYEENRAVDNGAAPAAFMLKKGYEERQQREECVLRDDKNWIKLVRPYIVLDYEHILATNYCLPAKEHIDDDENWTLLWAFDYKLVISLGLSIIHLLAADYNSSSCPIRVMDTIVKWMQMNLTRWRSKSSEWKANVHVLDYSQRIVVVRGRGRDRKISAHERNNDDDEDDNIGVC